ncbi:hypothetical protein LCGC14_1620930, partial [marine sediment metagenome]
MAKKKRGFINRLVGNLVPKASKEEVALITRRVSKRVRAQMKKQLSIDTMAQNRFPLTETPFFGGLQVEAGPVQENHLARMTTWFFTPMLGQPRNVNINQIRDFSLSFWVKICVNAVLDEIATVGWKIVPKEPDKFKELEDDSAEKKAIEEKIAEIEKFFQNPNRNAESWSTIRRAWHKDIMELDSGVLVKVFSAGSFEEGEEGEPKTISQEVITKNYKLEKNAKTGEIEKKIADDGKDHEFTLKKKILKEGKERDDALKKGEFKLNEIYARDGGSFLKEADIFGITMGYYQYSFLQKFALPEFFNKKEIVFSTRYPRSNSVYGWSVVQSIFDIIESLNASLIYNRDFFQNQAIPHGMLSMIDMPNEQLLKFRAYWENHVKGKAHKFPITNFKTDFQKFITTNREMEFLNSQKWYANLVCAMFGTTPGELGINVSPTGTASRATQEGQERVHLRKAIKPLLAIEEYHINTEIIPEFFGEEEEVTVMYQCKELDLAEELRQQKIDESDLDRGVRTINEVRIERGLDPVEWGDTPMQVAQREAQAEQFQALQDRDTFAGDNRREDREGRVAEGTPDIDETKSTKMSEIVKNLSKADHGNTGHEEESSHNKPKKKPKDKEREDKSDEVRDEAKSYSEFIIKEFGKLEKEVLSSVEKSLDEFFTKSGTFRKKTFGS